MLRTRLFLGWAALALLGSLSVAAPAEAPVPAPQPTEPDRPMSAEEFEAALHWQQGVVPLPNHLATLNVPASFRYLEPQQSSAILQAWGNPPEAAQGVLGMLFPADQGPTTEGAWAVVITYQKDGHVSDDDADKTDYTKLLAGMKKGAADSNEARKSAGFEPVELMGWAEPPRYDRTSHKMYWARELHFGDAKENTLNYDVRILGREGVLVLNAIASMGHLPQVRDGMRDVIGFVDFDAGQRYTDYVEGKDKLAGYGVAALVGGAATAVAAKAGLFKVLIGALIAAKKFVIIGLLGLGAALRKLFGGKKADPTAPIEPT
jgi:uncharacterized membrane-anchored protein